MQDGSKKIIFYSPAYTPVIGGTEQQTRNLAEFWAAQGKKVTVITKNPGDLPSTETINRVNVVRFKIPAVPFLGNSLFGARLFFFLRSERSSIACLISQMFNTEALILSRLTKCLNIPFLVRPSSGGPDGNLDKMKRTWGGNCKARRLARNSQFLIAINDQISKEFKATNLIDVVKIPNGVDTNRFAPSAQRADPPGALFVGRLDKVKNLDMFLTVWADVVKKIPSAVLMIAGDGPERPALEALSQKLNLSAHVRFLGEVKTAEALYQHASVFILPSHREGVSNALLEAMSSGLAVAVSDIGGNRLLVKDSSMGLRFKPTDKMAWAEGLTRLMSDAALRQSLGQAARRNIEENFSLQKTAAAYETLFQAIASAPFGTPFPILAYHRTCSPTQYGIDITPDVFETQIRWLAENGYASTTLNNLHQRKKIVITFDDGHKDTFTTAFPILKKYGFTATIFLNTSFLGKTYWVEGRRPDKVTWNEQQPAHFDAKSPTSRVYSFMTWEEAAELKDAGWDIGSHGVTHPFLTDLAPAELKAELENSRRQISEKLSVNPQFFCYPSGDNNAAVRQAVKAAGYQGAVLSKSHYDLFYHWHDPFALDRIGVWNDVALWKFKMLVKGRYAKRYRAIPSFVWAGARFFYRFFR